MAGTPGTCSGVASGEEKDPMRYATGMLVAASGQIYRTEENENKEPVSQSRWSGTKKHRLVLSGLQAVAKPAGHPSIDFIGNLLANRDKFEKYEDANAKTSRQSYTNRSKQGQKPAHRQHKYNGGGQVVSGSLGVHLTPFADGGYASPGDSLPL
jgi:hypothetical protein